MIADSSIGTPPLELAARELHVESLLGHRLRDAAGVSLGRIEEIVAEVRGTDWIVVEVHVGPGALLERLTELTSLIPLPGFLRRRFGTRRCVPWNRLDLSDPSRPRVRAEG